MGNPKENPLIDESLAAESIQGADDAAAMPGRLHRYSKAHHRAVEMAHYATAQGDVKLAAKLHNCGSYLLFRDYYTVNKVRLHAAQFCKKHLVCPFCAIRRGAKMVKAYMDRLQVIQSTNPGLKAYLVTLTVKNGEDLRERFEHLQKSVQFLHRTRSRDRQKSEARKASAAVWSYEFKRGTGSGTWHPHVHAVWLCEEKPDARLLSEQWKSITGDSFIVDVTPFHNQDDVLTGFLEVFKYAVKFSDMSLADNWEGSQTLASKRLIASFGLFRGIEVPENLSDEALDDLPYFEQLYRFIHGAGYSLVRTEKTITPTPADKLKRPRGPSPMLRQNYASPHLVRGALAARDEVLARPLGVYVLEDGREVVGLDDFELRARAREAWRVQAVADYHLQRRLNCSPVVAPQAVGAVVKISRRYK